MNSKTAMRASACVLSRAGRLASSQPARPGGYKGGPDTHAGRGGTHAGRHAGRMLDVPALRDRPRPSQSFRSLCLHKLEVAGNRKRSAQHFFESSRQDGSALARRDGGAGRRPKSFGSSKRALTLASALSNLHGSETFIPTWCTLGAGRRVRDSCQRARIAKLVLFRSPLRLLRVQ
jgi:hypothetical protein